MPRLLAVLLLITILVPAALADQPRWSFEGILPAIFQEYEPLANAAYTREGRVLSAEEAASAMLIKAGQPVVLIRDGEVMGSGTIEEFVAKQHKEALNMRLLFFRAGGFPEGVEIPDVPVGPSVLEDAGYDLYVLTDKNVEVLAPDPAYTDITWGVHDYCVRVGGLRFAIIRENWPFNSLKRGWQVIKFEDTGNIKVHADNTWQPPR